MSENKTHFLFPQKSYGPKMSWAKERLLTRGWPYMLWLLKGGDFLKFYKTVITLIITVVFLSGCSQTNIDKQSGKTINSSSGNIVKTAEPRKESDLDQNAEAEYYPTDNTGYKMIGNARFNFWIDIPNGWKAFDRSVNGDGYIILADNTNIDIRANGGLNIKSPQENIDDLNSDNKSVSDFTFRNGMVGKQVIKSDSEMRFTCFFSDRHINFYVNYEKDKNWFNENKDTILYIAKSLRSGLQNDDKDVITDIESWNHPVKDVFINNDIKITRVELINDRTYPIFYVELPYEVNLENENAIRYMFNEIALNNGFWDYEIKDETHNIAVKVRCDKKTKKVTEVNINGEDNYFKRLYINKNKNLINEITTKNASDLHIMAKDDVDNDGNIEMAVEYEDKLYLIRDKKSKREFIGEIKDYVGVVHEIDSVEIKQLDKSKMKYIFVYSSQSANGGNGFTIYSLENNEISMINNNFYGATAKGHSTLEDINGDGNTDSVLRIKHYDLQTHFLAEYRNWDGSGEYQHKIEYGNDEGKFKYPSTPELVIQNYIEDYYWKEYLSEEMNLLTGGRKLDMPDFVDDFGDQSTLEYGRLYLDCKVVSDTPKEKVFMVKENGEGIEYYFTTKLDKNWVITAISKNKP